jgi:hypothetical protein
MHLSKDVFYVIIRKLKKIDNHVMHVEVKKNVKNVNHIHLNRHLNFLIFVNSNKYQLMNVRRFLENHFIVALIMFSAHIRFSFFSVLVGYV